MVNGSYLPTYVPSLKDREGRLLKPGKRGSSSGVVDIPALLLCLHSLGMPSPPYSMQQNLLQRPFLQGSSESHSMFCLNCSCQSSYIITSGWHFIFLLNSLVSCPPHAWACIITQPLWGQEPSLVSSCIPLEPFTHSLTLLISFEYLPRAGNCPIPGH